MGVVTQFGNEWKICDPGSFEMGHLVGAAEYDADGNLAEFSPGGYVMGLGEIDGRSVSVGGDDFTLSAEARMTSTSSPTTSLNH